MIKTLSDYEASILQYHVELQHLPEYHPEFEKIQDQLSRQLKAWADKLSITVHRAENEQTGWIAEEIGYPVIPMATIKGGGARQVGDYHAYLEDYDMFAGVLVERKGTTRKNGRMVGCDLYNSFSKKDNRRRFYAEVGRFKQDSRFNQMVLIAECSNLEYLSYKPGFNGKQWNTCGYGMSVAARRATLAKLVMMGCSVYFAGTRQASVEYYHDLIQQWCRWNYAKILNLENSQ